MSQGAPVGFATGAVRAPGFGLLITALGVAQIFAWGSSYYLMAVVAQPIADDTGWPLAWVVGGLSLGLLVAGLISPRVGRLIQHRGGRPVLAASAVLLAAGLGVLALAQTLPVYLAAWVVIGVGMGAGLYDPAFATLGRIFGRGARAPITALTLAGGLASTVSWPATQFLLETVGWRGAYLVFAALLALLAAPLHAFALPRQRVGSDGSEKADNRSAASHVKPAPVLPARGIAFVLVAAAFSSYAFVPSALSAQLLAIFQRLGLAPVTVVAIGMVFGPAQVLARICELAFARHTHPLWVARFATGVLVVAFALLALLPFSVLLAAVFAAMYGMANGLMTIARGTVPLSLFGAAGYGKLMGRIGGPFLIVQAVAPVCLSYVAERSSDAAGLALVAAFAAASLLCFALI